jgi:hypothetical protein
MLLAMPDVGPILAPIARSLVLAGKRADATLAIAAIGALPVGHRLLGVLCDWMLTLASDDLGIGDRGHGLAKGAERLPLASAERCSEP